MERQWALPYSNHLVFINVSQHKLRVGIESRKRSICSGSGQVAGLALAVKEKAGLCQMGWFTQGR